MSRNFGARYWRTIAGPFAGDAAPVGAQVANNPATGAGILFRAGVTVGDLSKITTRLQGYFKSSVAGLTVTGQLYVAAAAGTGAGDWIAVGDPLAAIPQNRLFVSAGFVGDADVVIGLTPSVALIGGDTLDLYLEEIGS